MGVTCQILINKSREGVYRPGDAVKGVVKYTVDEPTEFKDVDFSFLGKGKCCWSESTSNKSSITYYGSEEYIQTHINIINKRADELITLYGAYEHPFEFYLPEKLPSSFKNSTGSIVYCLQLKLVKPQLFSFNKVFAAEIPVYGTVDLLNSQGQPLPDGPVIFGLEKCLFTLFDSKRPFIKLKAEIAKTRLTPGENAYLSCAVTNHSNTDVVGVKAEVYCHTTYTANCGKTRKCSKKLKNCESEMPGVPAHQEKSFTCVVPTLPKCYSIQYSRVVCREYRVRVTVRLPMPHMNASVEMPLVIGELKSLESCIEANDNTELPPPYFEAVCEEKTDGARDGGWNVAKKRDK